MNYQVRGTIILSLSQGVNRHIAICSSPSRCVRGRGEAFDHRSVHLVAPLRRLAGGVAAIAAGDLSVRVAGGGTAEMGELVEGFNQMAQSLAAQRAQLEADRAAAPLRRPAGGRGLCRGGRQRHPARDRRQPLRDEAPRARTASALAADRGHAAGRRHAGERDGRRAAGPRRRDAANEPRCRGHLSRAR